MRALCLAILILALPGPLLAQDAEAREILTALYSQVPSEAAWGAYRAGEQGIRAAIPRLVELMQPTPGKWSFGEEGKHLRLTVLDALIRLKAKVPGDLDADRVLRQGEGAFRDRKIILLSGRPKENRAQLLELFKAGAPGAFDLETVAVGNLLAGVRAAGFTARLLGLMEFRLDINVFSPGDPYEISGTRVRRILGRQRPVPPEGFPPFARYEFFTREVPGAKLLADGPRPIWTVRQEAMRDASSHALLDRTDCAFEWLEVLLGEDPGQLRFSVRAGPAVAFLGRENFAERARAARLELIRPWYGLLDRCLKARRIEPHAARGIEPEVLATITDRRKDRSVALPEVRFTDWVFEEEFGPGGEFGGRTGHRNLRALGGSTATEAAVDLGLDWLDRHQDVTGCWDSDGFSGRYARDACPGQGLADLDLVNTSLALLAFLGAACTDHHGDHQRTVRRGLDWLLSQQGEDGRFSSGSTRLNRYEHALATLTVAEAFAGTWDPVLAESARRGIEVLRAERRPDGTWGDKAKADPALTFWAIRALWNARSCGLELSQEETDVLRPHFKAWETADLMLTGPLFPRSKASLLSLIVFCRVRQKHQWDYRAWKDPRIAGIAESLKEPADIGEWDCGTLGMFHAGGDHWKAFNLKMKQTLLPRQVQEGCEMGSWNPADFNETRLGRVGVTACLVGCLEVYYRYGICF